MLALEGMGGLGCLAIRVPRSLLMAIPEAAGRFILVAWTATAAGMKGPGALEFVPQNPVLLLDASDHVVLLSVNPASDRHE